MSAVFTVLGIVAIVGAVLWLCARNAEPECRRLIRQAERERAKRPRVR